MVNKSAIVFMFLIIFVTLVSTIDARKLLEVDQQIKKEQVLSPDNKQPPTDRVFPSAPSKGSHTVVVTLNEDVIYRHLAAIDRILRSVPSPGVGN
ncbi:hypothetical protein Leryth_023901 [Lithospermum erythrorhizon]|nr:hypothetical protein Leryth_023901 [Lithospermum erythrorhizon]